ncbi:MAG: hypothetical protein BGO97_13325 [Micrococcales bacterium 70-64]|nr:hypothetical protein [Leifsonia sp.]ODU64918.1 MAG: hypothetical protein ABT06_13325 [Leifsonia sp. SCN 70-46]OJX86610.1 MAG: hypothetical protein BGO97_13325 [Micrococcales bacterium 70-64]
MGPFLSSVQVIGGPLPVVLWVLAGLALVALAVRPLPRGRRVRWALVVVSALVLGALVGLLVCWVVGDVLNVFDVALSPVSRGWVAAAFGGLAVAVASLVRSRPARRAGAVGAALLFVLVGAVGVNADFGQYPTLASIVGASSFPDLPRALLDAERTSTAAAGAGVAGEPAKGVVGAVTIPATVSHFAARQALVYLPPAALVPNPPALPVLVMLSGQPGSPENLFLAGHIDAELDAYARQHDGLAPIIVAPDQLSAPDVNPMCVDSAIGNSATYLTVDVPAWIRANLHVDDGPGGWGIGGFSQGGTCSIQLGAAHPDLFGAILDISGELEPKVGSPAHTTAVGFGGDSAAYEAAKPLAILSAHTPYAATTAVFGAGSLDTKYTPWIATVEGAAAAAGMHTTLLSSPGTAHDWYTVRSIFSQALPVLARAWGLAS